MLSQLFKWLLAFFSPKTTPTPTPTPIVPEIKPQPQPEPNSRLSEFCNAIRDYEGSPGDRNYRNNNPGNCRYSPVGYLPIYGTVLKDKDGFAIFKNYATGFLYLKNMIKGKVAKNPNQTLFQFMTIYAPSGDGNNPVTYSNFIARRIGASVDTPMKLLI